MVKAAISDFNPVASWASDGLSKLYQKSHLRPKRVRSSAELFGEARGVDLLGSGGKVVGVERTGITKTKATTAVRACCLQAASYQCINQLPRALLVAHPGSPLNSGE